MTGNRKIGRAGRNALGWSLVLAAATTAAWGKDDMIKGFFCDTGKGLAYSATGGFGPDGESMDCARGAASGYPGARRPAVRQRVLWQLFPAGRLRRNVSGDALLVADVPGHRARA